MFLRNSFPEVTVPSNSPREFTKLIERSLGQILKNRPSTICGRQPVKILKGYGLLKQTISLQIF